MVNDFQLNHTRRSIWRKTKCLGQTGQRRWPSCSQISLLWQHQHGETPGRLSTSQQWLVTRASTSDMRPQTRQRGNKDCRGPSPRRQPMRFPSMPLRQTGWRSRHSRAILQTRHSQSNSPSPAQRHRPPRLGESKHSFSAGTLWSLKGRRQVTWRHDVHPMARRKKCHLGRHRQRHSRVHLSATCAAAWRKGRPAERKPQVRSSRPLVHLHPARFRDLWTNPW